MKNPIAVLNRFFGRGKPLSNQDDEITMGRLSTKTAMAVQKLLNGKVPSHLLTIEHIKEDFVADCMDLHMCPISKTACNLIRLARPDIYKTNSAVEEIADIHPPVAISNGSTRMLSILSRHGLGEKGQCSLVLQLDAKGSIPGFFVVGEVEVSDALISAFESIGARTVSLDADMFNSLDHVGVFKDPALSDELAHIIGIAEILN